jgi:hypothetical protein
MAKGPVLVMGMHRSGTSLIAHLINIAGASAGNPDALFPPSRSNRDGYWENRNFVFFNDRLLKLLGASWIVPPKSGDLVHALLDNPELVIEARELIASFSSETLWFCKDPRFSVLLPFWRVLLPDAMYVISVRHPLSVSASLMRREGFPRYASLLLWQVYMESILRELPERSNVVFVPYEELLLNPLPLCERLKSFIGDSLAVSTPRQPIEKMLEVIRKDLFQSTSPDDVEKEILLDQSQQELYRRLILFANSETYCNQTIDDNHAIYPGWREYLSLWAGVRTFVRDIYKRNPH